MTDDQQKSAVIHPAHYAQYKIEPITFIMENDLPYWMGNVIKYVLRASAKNGTEDLRKAIRYIEMQIQLLEGGRADPKEML